VSVPADHQLPSAAPGGRSRPEPPDNLRRVVESATALFAQHGLNTTLAEVARHAGVGVATVYRRFANKDDLIYEVYAARLRAHEEVARRAAETIDAGDGFLQFFAQSITELAADKGLRELTMGLFRAARVHLCRLGGSRHRRIGRPGRLVRGSPGSRRRRARELGFAYAAGF
jgi:AcrR family transcriptional regulator